MKIVCIADCHGYYKKLAMPDGDMLLHAGDFCYADSTHEIFAFNNWLGKLPYLRKVIVAGNHDRVFETKPDLASYGITNATYLQDSWAIIPCNPIPQIGVFEGLKIWGSPVTPPFMNWAFMRDEEAIKRHWDMIPDDIHVLITHGPPLGIMDQTQDGYHAGCPYLLKTIERLKKLKLHVFGHIHEGYGVNRIGGVTFVNASKDYHPKNNPPIVVEL